MRFASSFRSARSAEKSRVETSVATAHDATDTVSPDAGSDAPATRKSARSVSRTSRRIATIGLGLGLIVVGGATPALASVAVSAVSPVQTRTVTEAGNIVQLSADGAANSLRLFDGAKSALKDANDAEAMVANSGLDFAATAPSIDTTRLEELISQYSGMRNVPQALLAQLNDDIGGATLRVISDTLSLRAGLDDAQAAYDEALRLAEEKRIADEAAAAQAAADQQAAAEAAAAAANTPEGAQAIARDMAASQYGWGDDQFQCLSSLWNKESGWNYQAENSSSGAYGIPQSLPGSKMSSIADDWQTNASTQIAWGLQYIAGSYGTPCSAWSHSQATDWY